MDLAIPYEQSFATLGIEMTQANDQLVCAVVPVRPTLLQPWVNVVSFSPDASRLASVGDDGMVRLWVSAKTHGGWSAWVPFSPDGGVAFSPDGRGLASADDGAAVHLWDSRDLAAISQLKLGAPLAALAWGTLGITVAAHTGLVQLAIIDRAANTTTR